MLCVKLAVIIFLVCMTQAKVSKPKAPAVKPAGKYQSFPKVHYNDHCEDLADNFCDQTGPNSCENFRAYCALLLNNANKVRGVSVNMQQLWDFSFYVLNTFFPIIAKGKVDVPVPIEGINPNGTKRALLEPNCPTFCPYERAPICAGLLYFFNRETYSNKCEMKVYACQQRTPIMKVKDGEC